MGNAEYMGIIKYSRYYCSKMVTKTEKCSYTEYKIVPGRGSRFISKDGRTHYFISTKARSLFHQKIKPVKLTWTLAWRAYNKKIKVDELQKKRTRKTTRIQKAVVGMSIEEIRRRRPSLARTETRPTILLLNRSRIAKPRPCRPRKPTRRSSRRMLPRLLTWLSRRSPVARAERDE